VRARELLALQMTNIEIPDRQAVALDVDSRPIVSFRSKGRACLLARFVLGRLLQPQVESSRSKKGTGGANDRPKGRGRRRLSIRVRARNGEFRRTRKAPWRAHRRTREKK